MAKKQILMKRSLAMLLAFIMVLTLLPGAVATPLETAVEDVETLPPGNDLAPTVAAEVQPIADVAVPLNTGTLIGAWDVTAEASDGLLQSGAAPNPLRTAERNLASGTYVRFRSANTAENRFQLSTQASRRILRSNGGTDDAFVEIHGVPDGDFRIVVSGQAEGSFGDIDAADLNARLGIGGDASAPAVTTATGSLPQARASVESITLDFERTGNTGGNIASFLLVRDGNATRTHGRLEVTEIRLYSLEDNGGTTTPPTYSLVLNDPLPVGTAAVTGGSGTFIADIAGLAHAHPGMTGQWQLGGNTGNQQFRGTSNEGKGPASEERFGWEPAAANRTIGIENVTGTVTLRMHALAGMAHGNWGAMLGSTELFRIVSYDAGVSGTYQVLDTITLDDVYNDGLFLGAGTATLLIAETTFTTTDGFFIMQPSWDGTVPARPRLRVLSFEAWTGAGMDITASPQNLTATPEMEAVRLTWNTVSGATRHEVSYRAYPNGTFNAWATTTAQSNHTVLGLATGAEYEFRVRAHDGTNPSEYSTVQGAPLAPMPVISITGIAADATHNFGTVAHDFTTVTPLSITVENIGTAVANDLAVTLTSGGTSFELSGFTAGNLAVSATETFTVAPRIPLPGGIHNGVVTITADGVEAVSFNLTFNVGFQDAPVDWDTQATYLWDFRGFPAYMLNNYPVQGQDARAMFLVLRDDVLSSMANSVYQVAPNASRPHLDWVISQGLPNQGVRPSGNVGATFIEPNGTGRAIATTETLRGPIRVEFVAHTVINGGVAHIPISFGDQSVTLTVTGTAASPNVVSAVFTGMEEELLSFEWPWGPAGLTVAPGRPGIQAIRIYEGEFTGPWLSVPTGTELNFRGLTENYTLANLETETVVLSNVGDGATNISHTISPEFVVTGMPSSLNGGADATISVRPAVGLAPGLHATTLLITTDNANTIHIPVRVEVFPTPDFPSGVDLFYGGAPTSTLSQFPNVLTEVPAWDHNFRRIVFTEDSHLVRMNGQERDASTSLAIPFMQNGVLWVPIEAARWAMPNATFTVDAGGQLTVTGAGGVYEGLALIATQVPHGGDAIFVPIENIAREVGGINFGVDTRSNTIILTTGTFSHNNVLFNDMNSQAEAWYGSPNSLAIANNLVYIQRDNGGWPRGNGQINAAPFSPDVGGMSPQAVQTIHAGRAAADSYFGRGISTFEPRFLLRMYEATGIERFRDSGLLGLDTILRTQDPQGAWPYNVEGGQYHRALSISDNALVHILNLLMDIEGGMFHDTVGSVRVADSSAAFQLGMDFILRTQQSSSAFADGVERRTAWAFAVYQTDLPTPPGAVTGHPHFRPGTPGEPAWQREFEPPGITNNESVGMVRFLMSIPEPCQDIIDAVSAAVFYFDYVAIRGWRLHFDNFGPLHPQLNRHLVADPNARLVWPRFTDIDTLTPLFSDRHTPSGSPHMGVLASDFEAEFGPWLGVGFDHISHNSNGVTNSRGGTLRNLYRLPDGTFTTDSALGVFDIQATYHNLSFERRIGYHYMGHWPESLPQEYAAWRIRVGLDTPPTGGGGGGGGGGPLPTPTPTPTPPAPDFPFVDVPANAWYREYVEQVLEMGLMNGISDTEFAPNDNLSRAMTVTILYRLAGEPAVRFSRAFSDVAPGRWYSDAVAWAVQNDIAQGIGGGRFDPNANVTREQMATMLFRYAEFMDFDTSVDGWATNFVDANQVSSWALEALQWANANDLIRGQGGNRVNPGGTATRAERAAIIVRFIDGFM